MEKQEREFEIDYPFDWRYSVTIEEMKKDIEELEKRGATEIQIEADVFYDVASVSIRAICSRLETDEECAARIANEAKVKERQEAIDRAAYEKLKAKFGQ